MKKLRLTFAGVFAAALTSAAAPTDIRLNEVHLNVPGPDGNFEFIELKSINNIAEPLTGLSLVIINNNKIDDDTKLPKNIGEVREIFDLGDLSTGSNGLLLLGNGYTANPRGGPWSGFVDPATNVADPSGLGDSDIGSNDGLTILLVSGATPALIKGADVDTDDDQILDWADPTPPANRQFATQPWTTVVDSIGTRDRGKQVDPNVAVTNPYVISTAIINTVWASSTLQDRDPDTFARQLGNNTPNAAASWYGGKLHGTTSTTITYESPTRIFGPGGMLGEVTPGRANLASTLGATSFRINEVGLNPVGDNDRFQYIEIINTGTAANGFVPTARSLNGYWLVMVDSYDNPSTPNDEVGTVIEKWDLSSMATGTNGLLLIGNDFTATYNAFLDLASPQSGFGDPESHDAIPADGTIPAIPAATGLSEGDIGFKNGFTLYLVQNLSATAPSDIDTNNDGVIDTPIAPAANIADQVGFSQVGKTGKGRTYSTVDLRTVMPTEMVPDNFGRKPKAGNLMAVAATEWYGGVYPGGSPGFDVAYSIQKVTPAVGAPYDPVFGGYRGAGTPGLPNVSAAINASSPPVAASIRINELMINPTDTVANEKDDTREYIELESTNGGLAYLDNLWVIVVDLEGSVGAVAESFPLDGSMTGLNGIAIIGDNYDDPTNYPYASVDGDLTPFASAIDPVVSIGGNDLPNNSMAVMILRNPKTGPGTRLTLSADGLTLSGNLNLDPEHLGTLVPPAQVADEVVDSIVLSTVNPGTGYGWINSTAFKPHHIARTPGDFTPSNGGSYYYGQLSQAAAAFPAMEYTSVFSGPFKGAASPGRPNHTAPTGPISVGSVVINELNFDPPGADNNFEFAELLDTGGKRRSLNGYYLVLLDNVVNNTGSIRHYWSLDGMSTGDNGLFVLGNRYPLGGTNNPWSAVMRPETRVGDPIGREGLSTSFNDGSLGDETDNLNLCLVLVRGFNRFIGFDMDQVVGDGSAQTPVDSSGDGIFDRTAWLGGNTTGIHDSIMFRDFIKVSPDPVSPPPGYPWDGFPYAGIADIGPLYLEPAAHVFYHPDSIARFSGEVTPNSAAAWYGGDLNGGVTGNTGTGVAYVTGDAEHPPFPTGLISGRATPGQPNLARNGNVDPDGDGIPTFLELALGSNPNAVDAVSPLPVASTVKVGADTFAAISYRRIRGGVANGSSYVAETYTYTIETSTDLNTWTAAGANAVQDGTGVTNADPDTETVKFRLTTPVNAGPRTYMRLRISRS